MAGVSAETVGEIEHRMCLAGELDPLVHPDRRTHIAQLAEGGTGCAERPGHDDLVPRSRA